MIKVKTTYLKNKNDGGRGTDRREDRSRVMETRFTPEKYKRRDSHHEGISEYPGHVFTLVPLKYCSRRIFTVLNTNQRFSTVERIKSSLN